MIMGQAIANKAREAYEAKQTLAKEANHEQHTGAGDAGSWRNCSGAWPRRCMTLTV